MIGAAHLRLVLVSALIVACKGGDATTDDTTAASTGTTSTTGTTTDTTAMSTGATTGATTTTGTPGTTSPTGTSTTGTSTTGSTTGDPIACDPQNLPPEGSACAEPGAFCSPGCQDPCQFCNVLECVDGTWQPAEVFPAPCLSCDEVCPPVLAANCPGGPPDLAACVAGCMQNQAGRCQLAFHQMLACIGPAPTFTCDMLGRPSAAGCETQFDALYACLMP